MGEPHARMPGPMHCPMCNMCVLPSSHMSDCSTLPRISSPVGTCRGFGLGFRGVDFGVLGKQPWASLASNHHPRMKLEAARGLQPQ